MKRIKHPFKYTPSVATDIRAAFRRIERERLAAEEVRRKEAEAAAAAAAETAKKVAPIKARG